MGRGMTHREPAHGDVVESHLFRVGDRLTDVNLDELLIGINTGELRQECGRGRVNLTEPERMITRPIQDVLPRHGLIQPVAVEIDGTGVILAIVILKPMPVDAVAVGVEIAKERVIDRNGPHVALLMLPARDLFRPFDHDLFPGHRLVDDALLVGISPTGGTHAFPIDALMNGNHVSGLGNSGGRGDQAKRGRCIPIVAVTPRLSHMVCAWLTRSPFLDARQTRF